jgi:CyaY protein
MPTQPLPDTLTDVEYDARSRAVLAAVEAAVDRMLDDDIVDIDSQRTGGLLELTFPNRSVVVVNTRPPLQEIWLAAKSGGFHFKLCEGRWLDTRGGREFFQALSGCASEQAGKALVFEPAPAGD